MKRETWYIIGLVGLAVVIMIRKNWLSLAAVVTASFESFSSVPYWDVSRWSWGFGTRVPGSVDDRTVRPSGTISRAQALADMKRHITNDYNALAPRVTRPLKVNQWAAYLSFSYNEGTGNADNLLTNINSGDDQALEIQWKKYVYADGVVNSDLVDRRAREWLLWSENIF